MNTQEEFLTKICSFYISDWHLVTMLLPYINKKLNEGVKIATVLEKDIRENVKTLLERLNLKVENESRILDINWNKISTNKNFNIKNLFSNINNEVIIIVNGKREFIENANNNLIKYIESNSIKQNIKIINCYEIVEFDGSITDILDRHDKILNTSGEKEIYEVFEDYERKKKIG